jgi:hypothetical protein
MKRKNRKSFLKQERDGNVRSPFKKSPHFPEIFYKIYVNTIRVHLLFLFSTKICKVKTLCR